MLATAGASVGGGTGYGDVTAYGQIGVAANNASD